MSILGRYLFRETLRPALVALFVMLAIIWLMQSLRFMDLIINKGLDVGLFLWITLLIVPSLLIIVLPLAVFAGGCFFFKRLNDDHELPGFFSAGLSRWQVFRPAAGVALTTVGICYLLTFWLIPAGMTEFKSLQFSLRQDGGNLLLEEGTFNDMGNGLMVYLKKRGINGNLRNLLVQDNRNPEKPVTWLADRGDIVFSEDGYPHLLLSNGSRQEVSEERISVLEFTEHTLDITRKLHQETTRWREAEERFVPELLAWESAPPDQIPRFKAELHKRLLWPLTPLPLLMIAAAFILRSKLRRSGVVRQVVAASVLATLYIAALMFFYSLASRGMMPALYGQWGLFILIVVATTYNLSDRTGIAS